MIRLKDILLESNNKKKVLFIGDSQTAAPYSYAYKFKKNNRSDYDVDINAKVSRRTSKMFDILRNMDNLSDYDIVVIMGGGNDGWRNTPTKAINNLTSMYSLVKRKNPTAKIVAITNPTKKFTADPSKYPSNDKIGPGIKSSDLPDYIIDATTIFNDKNYFSKDMIHLNRDAHAELYNQLVNTLGTEPMDRDVSYDDEININGLSFGDRGSAVIDMQRRLIHALDDPSAVGPPQDDGIFGSYTEAGLKRFQKQNNLETTGVYDAETKNKLEDVTIDMKDSELTNIKPISNSEWAEHFDINGSAVDQAANLLKKYEGFVATPMWDVNNWRIGHGSSTITKPDGSIITLSNDRNNKPNYTITTADAERDLKRRLETEFIPRKVMKHVPSNTPDGIIAALTSVAYNYGSLPNVVKKSLRQAESTGDFTVVADAVRSLQVHNNGINRKRRNREADYIMSAIASDTSYA